jgi:hypothetical protein
MVVINVFGYRMIYCAKQLAFIMCENIMINFNLKFDEPAKQEEFDNRFKQSQTEHGKSEAERIQRAINNSELDPNTNHLILQEPEATHNQREAARIARYYERPILYKLWWDEVYSILPMDDLYEHKARQHDAEFEEYLCSVGREDLTLKANNEPCYPLGKVSRSSKRAEAAYTVRKLNAKI